MYVFLFLTLLSFKHKVKTKSWFASIAVMDHLCDHWTLMSTLLDLVLQHDDVPYPVMVMF